MPTPKILPCGDSAVTIEFGDRIDPDINGMVLALDDIIRSKEVANREKDRAALPQLYALRDEIARRDS